MSKLAGASYVLDDAFLVRGEKSTMGMKMMKDFVAPLTATVARRLGDAGAKIVRGAENSTASFEIAPFGGVAGDWKVGFKPTYGAVSRYGLAAMSSSMDCVEVAANDMSTIEIVMDVLVGQDVADATTLPDFWENMPEESMLRVGVVAGMAEGADNFVENLKKNGHTAREIELPMCRYALAICRVVQAAETASAMMRYDGVRFGKQADGVKNLDDLYRRSRDEGLPEELKRQIMLGNYVVSTGQYEKYYLRAQQARTLLIDALDKIFEKFDVLLYTSDDALAVASAAGLPMMSVADVRLIGQKCSDRQLLKLAKEIR